MVPAIEKMEGSRFIIYLWCRDKEDCNRETYSAEIKQVGLDVNSCVLHDGFVRLYSEHDGIMPHPVICGGRVWTEYMVVQERLQRIIQGGLNIRVIDGRINSLRLQLCGIGYKGDSDWVTEGWWNIPADSCQKLLAGSLTARIYYLYAVDYDQGGEWGGRSYMCTHDRKFTI
jgi:hypothetical protein